MTSVKVSPTKVSVIVAPAVPIGQLDGRYDQLGSAANVQAASLQKNADLGDIGDAGSSRANIHIPALTPAACLATANVSSLSGLQTIDGYTLTAGDLVLLTGQSTTKTNGLYVAASSSWTRPTEMATGATMKARTCAVIQGTVHAGETWMLQTNSTITVDTTAQTWVLQQSSSVVSASGATNGNVPIANGSNGYAWGPAGAAVPIIAGNLGSSYTLAMGGSGLVRLFGTLNANCAITVSGWASGTSRAELILTQGGGFTLTINGTSVVIPSAAGAVYVQIDTDNGGSAVFVSVTGAPVTGFGVVVAKSASYAVQAADNSNIIVFNGATLTATLPSSAPAGPWAVTIVNENATALTVSPNGLTLNGSASSVTLAQNQGTTIYSDGTNYFYGSGLPGPTNTATRQVIRNQALGFTDQTFDIYSNGGGGGQAAAVLTTQQLEAFLIGLVAGDIVTNIFAAVSTPGSGTTPTGIYLGLYSAAGALLASTGNLASSSAWTSSGIKKIPFTAPYTVPTTGGYYLGILENGAFGTTAMKLMNSTLNGGVYPQIGTGAYCGVKQTGQATLPSPATFSGPDNNNFWFGWS